MSQRYYLAEPPCDERATLTDAEAHHLAHVMRGRVGDEVRLFDGLGYEYRAQIERLGKHDVALRVLTREGVDRELRVPIRIGVALPRGDRQQWLVEKLVELGVCELIPLETERGVALPTDKALERLRRSVIEASKQCGRNRLMTIRAAQTWSEFLHHTDENVARLVAHPYRDSVAESFWNSAPPGGYCFGVGPEGGWTDAELALAEQAHWQFSTLGSRILRIETAALTLAAWVQHATVR